MDDSSSEGSLKGLAADIKLAVKEDIQRIT